MLGHPPQGPYMHRVEVTGNAEATPSVHPVYDMADRMFTSDLEAQCDT